MVPGYLNVDMSAFKDFHTFREQTFGFRFDAFNALNIASYGNPDTGVADSNLWTDREPGQSRAVTGAASAVLRTLHLLARSGSILGSAGAIQIAPAFFCAVHR